MALAAMFAFAPMASAKTLKTPFEVAPGISLADQDDVGVNPGPGGPGPGSKSTAAKQPRIVGGRPVDISAVPWQIALTIAPDGRPANQRQFCGGSLVAPAVVITAAHCVFNREGTALEFAPQDISVITGRTVLSSSQGQELPVSQILVPQNNGVSLYNPQNSAFDVALLALGQQSTTGTPIQIPGPGEEQLWSEGRRALVSGWGHTRSEGQGSDQLLATDVYMTNDATCDRVYSGNFTNTSICAGLFKGGKDSCQGDSGGPLVVPTAEGAFRLAGDVQSGIGCAEPRTPGIYGRFGAGDVHTLLRQGVAQLTGGTDIAGSGGTPPLDVNLEQGENVALNHAEDACFSSRKCRSFNANKCKPNGIGVQCRETLTSKLRKGRKKTCKQTLLVSAESGAVTATHIGRKKCKKSK